MKQRRQILTVFSLAAALGMATLPPALAITDDYLIIPGQSIGQTHLGRNGAFYLNKLPKAAASDTSMQQTKLVWVSKKKDQRSDTLYIHTIANAAQLNAPIRGVFINQIEITSPSFHTSDGISTGSTKGQIFRHFPNARPLKGSKIMYSDKGIAFEFANSAADSPCISIAVYPLSFAPRIEGREQVNNYLHSYCIKDDKC
ncbi:MAG: hypothetical protein V7K89_26595 [Nostoc sp.]|uniref:hypothetical protein n=1 Tax=Nostoc sp. TaxID=1180 RepID=UPI002FF5F3F3